MKVTSAIVIFLLFFGCAASASGLRIDGSLTSMAWMRQNPVARDHEDFYTFLYEYVRLNMANLGDDSLSAYIHGRVREDVAGEEKPDWRAFSGYLNWSGPRDSSIRIGRQFLPDNLGFWEMDGIRAKVRGFKDFSHSAYAGFSVAPWAMNDDRDGLAGMELDFPKLWQLQSGLSVFASFDSENFKRVVIGGHLDSYDYGFSTLRKLNIYSKVNYDVINRELLHGSTAVNLNPLEKFGIYAEYYHGKQIFPEESIFSVFAVDDINEASFGLRYNIMEKINLEGRYGRYFSSLFPSNTYEVGVYRTVMSGMSFGMTLLGSEKSGVESSHNGARINIGHALTKKFSATVSAHYRDYRLRKSQERNNVYSLQLDLGYRVVDQVSAYLRLEDNIDANGDSYYRLLARMRFGFGYGQPGEEAGYGYHLR